MADDRTKDGLRLETASRVSGEYVVIARRYRPQTFAELIGQDHIAQALAAAIAASRVGHAYLFTGARGTGKTSAARILAKALNCKLGPTPTPCNECDICRSITAGEDMDVLEIDGASNRGIDEIRQLRQNVNVRPSRARFKVYIIDEVHMLTEPAFNALLKTLEEPPEHVKFIFCTTEPEKIPITILSRCQRFDFAGIQSKQIVDRLQQIATGEGVNAEPEALEVLARRAAGSMRDSQSLLEQLLAIGSQNISLADVHRLLGTAGAERIARLAETLIDSNAAGALAELDHAALEGVDVGVLLDQLLGYFRDVMAAAVGCPAESLLQISANQREAVQSAAKQLGLETILAVLQILDQTISRLKYLTHPRTVAEIALVRICKLEDIESLPQLISALRDGLPVAPIAASTGGTTAGLAAGEAQQTAASSKKKYDEPVAGNVFSNGSSGASYPTMPFGSLHASGQSNSPSSTASSNTLETDGASPAEHERVQDLSAELNGEAFAIRELIESNSIEDGIGVKSGLEIWRAAAAKLGGLAAEKAQQAENAAITAPNKLVVTFSKRYNFCKQFCERPEMAQRLKGILERLAHQALQLEFRLNDEETTQTAEQPKVTSSRQRMYEVCHQSFVRHALELFDATAIGIEDSAKS